MPAVGPFEDPQPTPRRTTVEQTAREVIGGDKRAAVRRIILWTLLIILIAGSAPAWIVLLPVALLMSTDGLL